MLNAEQLGISVPYLFRWLQRRHENKVSTANLVCTRKDATNTSKFHLVAKDLYGHKSNETVT